MSDTTYHRLGHQASPKRTRLERRPTQEDRVLQLLIAAYPGWVELPEILRLGVSQYSARIWSLRHQRGYTIENEVIKLPGGRKGGRFRLASKPTQTSLFERGR